MTPEEAAQFQSHFRTVATNIAGFIQGKAEVIDLSLVCLLAEGHLLIEDVPGVGKTSLARSIAATLGMSWHRIQFTPDLLPSDVTGVSVFRQDAGRFEFHPGPIFAHVVLADEINRASPRTQSALLEVMEERTVTVDGVSYTVPSPFMVIAGERARTSPNLAAIRAAGGEVVFAAESEGRLDLAAVLAALHGRGLSALMFEGGPVLSSALLAAGLVDRWRQFVAPVALGDGVGWPAVAPVAGAGTFTLTRTGTAGPDALLVHDRLSFAAKLDQVSR